MKTKSELEGKPTGDCIQGRANTTGKLKILHLENPENEADGINRVLKKAGVDFESVVVNTKAAFIKAIKEFSPDIILADNSLPSFNSHEALHIFHKTGIKIPFIIVTASMSDEFAADIIEKGADDYILKDGLIRLPNAIKKALENFRLKKDQEKLREELIINANRLHSLIVNSADGIAIYTAQGKLLYTSPSIYRILGYTQEEAMQLNLFEILHPDDREGSANKMAACLKAPGVATDKIIRRIKHKNGTWIWTEASMTNMLDVPGVDGIVDNFSDLTERKASEQKLIETSEALHAALNNVNRIMDSSVDIISSIDEEGKFVTVSAACERIWGYTPAELIGRKYMDFVFVEYSKVTQKVNNEIRNGEPVTMFENKYVHKDGRIIPMLWSSRWEEKDQVFYSVAKDATEKKILEKAIETERDRFFEMFSHAPASMAVLKGSDHMFEMANELYLNLTNRTNVKGKTVREVFPEIESQGLITLLDHVYKTGETYVANEQLVKLNKTGTQEVKEVYLNFVYQAYHNQQNEIEGIFVFVIDITDQQKAKENLLIISERLVLATTSAKIGIWDWDIVNDSMTWDNRMYELYGIGPQQFTGAYSVWQNGVHPDDIERAAKELNDAIKGLHDFDTEFRVMWPDKSVHFIKANAIVSRDENGVGLRMIGINTDITERKTGEEKILKLNAEITKSEKFFKGVIENSDDMITIIDTAGNTVYASPAVSKKFGYTNEECLQLNITDIVHPDDVVLMQEFVMKIMMHPGVPMECPLIRDKKKDGSYIWVEGTLTNFFETEGINAIVANFRDVTEKKKLEYLLAKTNKLAAIGSFEIDVLKGTVFWSDITKEIWGGEPGFVPLSETGISFFKEAGDKETIPQKVQQCIEQGTSWDEELPIVTHKGNFKWVRTIGEGEFVQNKCIKVYGSFQDITARKKAEIEVLKAYEEKNIILESIGDGFFAVDTNWIVTYWNSQSEKMLQTPKNKIIGHHLWKIFEDSIDSASYKKYHEAIETEQVIRFEDYHILLDKWYDISAYPSDNGLSVYFKDITDRKLAEKHMYEINKSLQKSIKELAISNNELEQFAHVASHDLQEPLRTVSSFLTLIEKKYGSIIDEKGKQYIHFAVDGAKRMRQIILDLLEFSKIGREKVQIEKVDLNELIHNIIALYSKQISENKAVITADKLPVLNISEPPIRQIFQNLISNSLKYQRVGIAPEITISAKDMTTHWQFAVTDNGIGIRKEFLDKIFIIFQRLHSQEKYSGTGLGLAITKKIIENAGGKIWVESEEEVGSSFYFTIPQKN